MKKLFSLCIGLLLFLSGNVFSQDLDALLNAETKPTVDFATATFKSTRIINTILIIRIRNPWTQDLTMLCLLELTLKPADMSFKSC